MRYLLLFFLASLCGIGATRAAITGKVLDASGKPLAGAKVIIQKSGGRQFIIQTTSTGIFASPRLDSGSYTATCSSPGYESQRFVNIIVVSASEQLLLNVSLEKDGLWGGSIVTHTYYRQSPASSRRKAHDSAYLLAKRATPGLKRSRSELPAPSSPPFFNVMAHAAGYKPAIIDAAKPGGVVTKTGDAIERTSRRDDAGVAALSTKAYRKDEEALIVAGGRTAVVAAEAHAGSLTSGEINDFSKWALWEDLSMESLKTYRDHWLFRLETRYTVIVKSREGAPLANAHVKMRDGSGAVWETMTDNTGKAELWRGMFETGVNPLPAHASASIDYGREHYSIPSLKPFAEGANILSTKASCFNPAKLDVAFIVDATGSMQDEINYLKVELRDILQKVHDSMPATDVQTGALFYRDVVDDFLTRASDLTTDFAKTEAFIADNNAGGGGDFPEAVDAALEAGLIDLHWRPDATARLAFLVLDAPPHDDPITVKKMQTLAAQYAARGIRLIPVVCSGSDKPTEYLMRSLALATNGTYLFLTDHSGIGGGHTAPTTSARVDVEYLNGLIYRVIYQCAYMPPCMESIVASDTARVADSASDISWRFWPNPTTGILHITHTHTSGYLLITDVTGKAILRVPADPSGTTTIDLGQYPAGIYAIRYNPGGDQWLSGKFVLTH